MLGTTGAADLRRDRPAWCGAVLRWTEFYEHESCGKCTPCREGTYWLVRRSCERLEHGEGTEEDLDTLLDICDNILGRAFCALGDGAASPITSAVQYFRDEFVQHHKRRRLPVRPGGTRPLLQERTSSMTVRARTAAGRRRPSTVTIDGVEIAVPKGTLVIRAAELLGIAIPRFCDHPLLDPVGACRQCLVEVEGQRKPLASCTTTVHRGHGGAAPSSPPRSPTRRSRA